MLFNSFEFWIFFGIVAGIYRFLGHKAQNRFLLVASYVFYGSWDWRFLSLIVLSTVVDYLAALQIAGSESERRRRVAVTVSMAVNLGLLGTFKYLGFFVESAADLLTLLGFSANLPSLRIILPVGISFYTFQTMSYTIDVYRRELQPTRDFLDFALYVSFFPQLVAGPVERGKRLLPQVVTPREVSGRDFSVGLYCILLGLFKKVVVADNMAIVANYVFAADPATLTAPEVLLGVAAFAFQIYGDFSGYSLIAQGTGAWLGFSLMDNFRHPYFATSPQDFWRRWHISLSTWLRDYLYIPLGGSRVGTLATYRNLMATMVLGGLWHGAAWTFVVWGTIHGAWLAAHRWLSGRWPRRGPLGAFATGVRMAATFLIVCVTWLFFRALSVSQAATFMASLFGSWAITDLAGAAWPLVAVYVVPLLLYEAWVERAGDLFAILDRHWLARALLYTVIVLALFWFPAPTPSEFIYFQF
jgi:D-alanyl-lipoteichoic acid acyltransferase DltB (MBOAT superfamily)